jgi:small subunit ribosomal protein S20
MANIKSQKKRALTNLKKNAALTGKRTELKSSIKAIYSAVEAQDKDAAVKAYDRANALLDKAITSGIKHKNYVARQKSRLSKVVKSI